MPANSEVYLTIVIPAYNEEAIIRETLTRVTDFLSTQDYHWEVIVVDDASTDSTVDVVNRFIVDRSDMLVRLLVNEQNRQKGATICRGVMDAGGKFTVFIDADYAYPIEQVENFLAKLENGAHIVVGNRVDPSTTYLVRPSTFNYIYQRYLLGRVFNLMVRTLLLGGVSDTQCGIKGFHTETARKLLTKMRISNFAFDVELLYIARRNGEEIVQIPVTYDYIDEPSSVRLFKHSITMFQSLIQIKINGWTRKYMINSGPGRKN
jgi:dolichyl-phosphate beta-glucosyltransferase